MCRATSTPDAPTRIAVAGVQARHRGVRIAEERHERALLVQRRALERVEEVLLDEQARRRRRVEDVAGNGQHERREEHVAEQRVGAVPPDVDPDHEAERDRELALEVRELRDFHDEAGRIERPVLHRELVVDAERALPADDVARVLERRALPPCATVARGLVGDVERDEDRELAGEPLQPSGSSAPIARTGQSRGDATASMLALRSGSRVAWVCRLGVLGTARRRRQPVPTNWRSSKLALPLLASESPMLIAVVPAGMGVVTRWCGSSRRLRG